MNIDRASAANGAAGGSATLSPSRDKEQGIPEPVIKHDERAKYIQQQL
jgi:hypothetical protein